jgi:hypothetical protein
MAILSSGFSQEYIAKLLHGTALDLEQGPGIRPPKEEGSEYFYNVMVTAYT